MRVAHKFELLDSPGGNLKKHSKPIPHFGGLGVFLSFIVGLIPVFPTENKVLCLILGGILLLFLGIVDDLKILSPLKKFIGQVFVVACFIVWGFHLKEIFFSHKFSMLISSFWMLSIINAFNLIDVMDGLSTVAAITSSFAFLICALASGNLEVTLLLTALIGSLTGFLFFNYPPASIYLGDGGSHFVGGILSATPFLISWSEKTPYGAIVPFIILGLPISETVLLIILRSINGIPPYKGSPHHFSIYLRNKGYSVDAVLLFSATVSIFLAAVGIGLFLGLISLASALLFAGSGFIVACYFIFSPPKSFVNKKNISLQPSKIIKNKINIFEKEGPRLR